MNTFTEIPELTLGCCTDNYFRYHSCEEYLNRLQRAASGLEGMSMRDVYASYHGVVRKGSEDFTFMPHGRTFLPP